MPNPDRYQLPVHNVETGENLPSEFDRTVAVHHEGNNLRIVLDEDPGGPRDGDEPNVFIERQPDHWLVIFHPDGGDPTCGIELYRDLVKVHDAGGTLLYKQDIEPMKDDRLAKYVESGGVRCPFCGSDDVDSGKIQADAGIAWATVTCNACGGEWKDEYKLVAAEIVAEPRKEDEDDAE